MSGGVRSLRSSTLIFKVPRDSWLQWRRSGAAARHRCEESFHCLVCPLVALYDVLFSVLYKTGPQKKQHNTSPHFFLFSYQNLGRRNYFCTIALIEKQEQEKFPRRCSAVRPAAEHVTG